MGKIVKNKELGEARMNPAVLDGIKGILQTHDF